MPINIKIMIDTYKNYAELKENETENTDYRIICIDRKSETTCICIHGFDIEPGTSEVTEEVAGDTYNLYKFEGIKKGRNLSLHITSSNFDEPQGDKLVKKSTQVISIHGAKGPDVITYIGGLDEALKNKVRKALTENGFHVEDAPIGLDGKTTNNIVNRGLTKAGCQLEITRGQRELFFKANNLKTHNRHDKTELFYKYTACIRKALKNSL